ncbi:hypothetical protein LTR16_000327 [Cryomyces antarcticus]|uniref:Beta-lactamase-related domain-containing protein n=1 Tax=Cryomyces antarcticus TaxID=329879 RepID=A0ABR0M1N9_9PEZI|nr:hypothetical protein LTR39_000187 [Cryomyces antarcticus]KAK5021226.1 hypothetical protein LTR60_000070 [Cryomyces antarcticus]KAK5257548.1 hypothetical protein LTR16_000327 [Cryomyces antarcticus]
MSESSSVTGIPSSSSPSTVPFVPVRRPDYMWQVAACSAEASPELVATCQMYEVSCVQRWHDSGGSAACNEQKRYIAISSTYPIPKSGLTPIPGSFQYAKAFGSRSLEEGKSNEPLEMNSVMFIASCTKLMTSIAAMQCVERGQINIDDDVAELLPELAGLEILAGFDDAGNPEMRRRKNAITLR